MLRPPLRMIAWVDIDDPINNTGAYLTLEQKIERIEIVCAVGALQAKILQRYMDLTSAADGSGSGSETHQLLLRVAPFTHWILVGISQKLQHEKWKMLRCDLPAMTLDGLRRHALAGLDCMDAMVNPAGLASYRSSRSSSRWGLRWCRTRNGGVSLAC